MAADVDLIFLIAATIVIALVKKRRLKESVRKIKTIPGTEKHLIEASSVCNVKITFGNVIALRKTNNEITNNKTFYI